MSNPPPNGYSHEDIFRDSWVRRALATVDLPDDEVTSFSRFSETFIEARTYFRSLPTSELNALRALVQSPVRVTPPARVSSFRGGPSRALPPSPKGSCCRR